jgi:hypothetical protein
LSFHVRQGAGSGLFQGPIRIHWDDHPWKQGDLQWIVRFLCIISFDWDRRSASAHSSCSMLWTSYILVIWSSWWILVCSMCRR